MLTRKTQVATNGQGKTLSVGFILLPHFTLIAFSAIVDLLRLSADEGDRSRPELCSWSVLGTDLNPITASCGLRVMPWEIMQRPERFDYIVVVGGLLHKGVDYHPAMLKFLRDAAAAGVQIAGVCTGSFALAEAQLLDGKRCCVSWYHLCDFLERYSKIVPIADQLFVQDGNVITCAGGLAALDLGAWMVERHLGPGRAQKSLHIMLTDKARSGLDAQPQPPGVGLVADPRVKRAMLLIEQNLSTPPKVQEIATNIGLSKRQLERLFRKIAGKTIQEFSRTLRVYYGLWLLANSNKSITAVAAESGFADPSHFNRLFRATFGCPPSVLRKEGPEIMKKIIWDHRGGSPESGPFKTGATVFLSRERRPYLQ
jgi:transcriptional regulator GlxA family with amidase domain